jgi:hypothetical protein
MGRSLFTLVDSGILMGLLMVFGGLEVDGCHSKNEIRSVPLLGYVFFWLFHWCSAYIRRLCIVVLLFPISVRLV